MSGTANEFDRTGGNYPDRGDADDIQPDQGAVRSDAGVGGSIADDVPPAPLGATQDEPAQDMHETNDEDRIAGIVMQTRADVGDAPQERIVDVLRQRFADVGLDIGDDRVVALAAEVAQR